MKVISDNIRFGLGSDYNIDLERIANRYAKLVLSTCRKSSGFGIVAVWLISWRFYENS